MAVIKPFKGVVYNTGKIKDISKVVAPPYDIIPKAMQNELYRASAYNIVRLELGKIAKTDDARNNRYIRARKSFDLWLKNKQLVRDEKDSIYIYSQKYRVGAKVIDRVGFMARMSLDEGKNKVKPHENTLAAPKLDRLSMIREAKANLSPIFVLYEDAEHKVLKILKDTCRKTKPFIDISFEGIRNRAWRLDNEADIKKIQDCMRDSGTFIADGHHRFEVSRMYYKELKETNAPKVLLESAGGIMVYFVESNEDMLTVLPAHRLIKDMAGLKKEEIIPRLRKFFIIESHRNLGSMMAKLDGLKSIHAFGIYLGNKQFYLLKLKSMTPIDRAIKGKSKDWKSLDVAILHLFIFQHVLGIRDDDDNVAFVKSPLDTAKFVDKGDFKIAFFLNPTKLAQIKRIASLGEKMPRKATYFYPKQLSGIVINKL